MPRVDRLAMDGGRVYLAGAGPGDPGMLTVRVAQWIDEADVVVHDNLVSPEILALIPATTQRIYAGKARGNHSMTQAQINALLVNLARAGKRVLRLKGGDPLLFGRGGEEVRALQEAGIPFAIAPGITAALGVAASAHIPLTHRDYAKTCVLATGHLRDYSVDLDWPALARPGQTLVFYMGLPGLAEICAQLVRHGLPPDWPAAIVAQGTTPRQQAVYGTLSCLPALAAAAALHPPTLIIVGEVVALLQTEKAVGV